MKNESNTSKKHSVISYITLAIGIICIFIAFVPPTRLVDIGSTAGDNITLFLMLVGIILSSIGLGKKTEKKLIPIISLIFSSSYFLYSLLQGVVVVLASL